MRHAGAIAAAAICALLGACGARQRDLGTGINTVERHYARPADNVWDATVASLKGMDLAIARDRHDTLGGEVVARRADGSEVTATVKATDKDRTDVWVRVEPGDRNMADLIHERIAEKLGLGEAKSAFFGGNSVDANYRVDLASGITAAEQTFRGMAVRTTDKEVHATWIQLDGRTGDSVPVRIKLERSDPNKTQATFIVGNSRSEDNLSLARRMKEEFDRHAQQHGD